MLGLDLGALAAVPVVRWMARDLRMPPPPHLAIMAPFATLSHGARSLPVFSAPPISGPGGTPARRRGTLFPSPRSEEHTSELQSRENIVCRLLLEKKKTNKLTKILIA